MLPFPPSINTLYFQGPKHGQKFLSKKGKEYKARITNLYGSDEMEPITCPIKVRIEMIPPDSRMRDIDNYIKPVLDGLKYLDIIVDDSQITKMAVLKRSKHPKYNRGMMLVYIREDESEMKDPSEMIDDFMLTNQLDFEDLKEFHAPTKKELGITKKYIKKKDRLEGGEV